MTSSCKAALACAALGWTVTAQAAAAAPTKPCLTSAEVETLAAFALPSLVDGVARKCSAALAPNAFLRTSAPALAARYRQESPANWNQVQPVIAKIAGDQFPANLGGEFGRALLESTITAALVQEVGVKDCPTVNRLVETLAPLPAPNTARLTAMLFEIGAKDEDSREMLFALCPTGVAAR